MTEEFKPLLLCCGKLAHLISSVWCFSKHTHTLPPPAFPGLPLLPVDTPNKATCVVSGYLGERSVSRPCLPGDRLHACSLPRLVFFPTPSPLHSTYLLPLMSILLSALVPFFSIIRVFCLWVFPHLFFFLFLASFSVCFTPDGQLPG